jgi:ppGpp synthetase/RelA/SpoT-type nucleotidyltranferase
MIEARDKARLRFVEERHIFEQLAEDIAHEIRILSVDAKIDCRVTHRVKDVGSFVKKAIAERLEDPWSEIYDKAGVRIVVHHVGDLTRAEALIRANFSVSWSSLDDPAKNDDEDRLRYPRLHFQVKPLTPTTSADRPTYNGHSCEVQLRTAAGDLWSSMSHKLLYKPSSDLPKDVRRSLYGLLALVEVYDREVQRAMELIGKSPDHLLNAILDQCERIYYTFCSNSYNSMLTREVLAIVLSTLHPEQQDGYADELESFAETRREELQEIYSRYGATSEAYKNGLFVLLGQPESIAVLERLSSRPILLEHIWQDRLPEELLEELQRLA